MKITDLLDDYCDETLSLPETAVSPKATLARTRKKLGLERRRRVPLGVAAAVAAAAMLSVTAFAAYETGWFGRIFGSDAALVEDHVVTYDPAGEAFVGTAVTQPSYTQEEQAMIDAGTMSVPAQAELSGEGVSASTEDFTFTLEEMLASEDTLIAVVRVDARTETANTLLQNAETGKGGSFHITALNNSGEGHEIELKNGGMGMDLLQLEDATAYFLLHNSGGQFAVEDGILFQFLSETGTVDLFEVPLTDLMDSAVTIPLDVSAYEGKGYQWETMTVTPMELVVYGSYTRSPDQSRPEVTITLKDGTCFELAGMSNGYACMPYGSYGSLSSAGTAGGPEDPFIKNSWVFSQLVDLNEIDHITVDGIDYTWN